MGGVAHQAENGVLGALGHVDLDFLALQPVDEVIPLFGGGVGFQNGDHRGKISFAKKLCSRGAAQLEVYFTGRLLRQHGTLLLFGEVIVKVIAAGKETVHSALPNA